MSRWIALAACAAGLAGCRLTPAPRAVVGHVTPQPPGEDAPAPRQAPAPRVSVPAAHAASAEQALRRFALRWCNWSWRDGGRQQRDLAAMATGALARSLAAEASSPASAAGLQSDKPSFRGTVEAVMLERAAADAAAAREALVVTREQGYADERPVEGGAHWQVYRARVVRVGDGWAIAGWEGEP